MKMEVILLLVLQEKELVPPLYKFIDLRSLFSYLVDACLAKSLITKNTLTLFRMQRHV